MKMKKKICFIMNHMRAGGAERVVSLLANAFSDKEYEVSLVVSTDEESFYELNGKINYKKLSIKHTKGSFIEKVKVNFYEIKKIIQFLKNEKPDVVISFIRNVPTIIACKIVGVKVIISERNNPIYDPPNPVWRVLRKFIYPLADGFVFQTSDARGFFSKDIQMKSCVIPNPLNEYIPNPSSCNKENKIVSVGRLAKQKDHETLLKAFAIVKDKLSDYNLIIYGEGNLRVELEKRIIELGLENRVLLPGNTGDLYNEILNAKLFVFSSIYEGYPNALIEAMALGLPVISTDCKYGPSELINDGYNGFLVEVGDYKEIAKKIEFIIQNEDIRQKISENATVIKNKLNSKVIINKWENYIKSVIG